MNRKIKNKYARGSSIYGLMLILCFVFSIAFGEPQKELNPFFDRHLEDLLEQNPAAAESEILSRLKKSPVADQAKLLTYLGRAYWQVEKLNKALSVYEEALVIREAEKDVAGQSLLLNLIAGVYWKLEERKSAEVILLKGLDLSKSIGDTRGTIRILNNLGLLYLETNELVKAREALEESLSIQSEKGEVNLGFVYNNLGLLALKVGNHDEALSYLDKAMKMHRQSGNLRELAFVYISISKVEETENNYRGMISNAEIALNLAQTYDIPSVIREGNELLARGHAAMGNYKEAYNAIQLAKREEQEFISTMNERSFIEARKRILNKLAGSPNVSVTFLGIGSEPFIWNKMALPWAITLVLLLILILVLWRVRKMLDWRDAELDLFKKSIDYPTTNGDENTGGEESAGVMPALVGENSGPLIAGVLIFDRNALNRRVYRLHAEKVDLIVREASSMSEFFACISAGYEGVGYLIGSNENQLSAIKIVERIKNLDTSSKILVFIGEEFSDESRFELEEKGLARFLSRPVQNEDLMQVFTAMANEGGKPPSRPEVNQQKKS